MGTEQMIGPEAGRCMHKMGGRAPHEASDKCKAGGEKQGRQLQARGGRLGVAQVGNRCRAGGLREQVASEGSQAAGAGGPHRGRAAGTSERGTARAAGAGRLHVVGWQHKQQWQHREVTTAQGGDDDGTGWQQQQWQRHYAAAIARMRQEVATVAAAVTAAIVVARSRAATAVATTI